MSGTQQDESTVLSADRTSNGEFFIDDYSHLRLSYYQYRDAMSIEVSDSAFNDSAYSTNASNNQSFNENNDTTTAGITNSTNSTKVAISKDWDEEERRKRREHYISQIPDLPHPSYTVASVIASASRRLDPKNRFVYNNRIEQGSPLEDGIGKFAPSRRSTLKPDTKL